MNPILPLDVFTADVEAHPMPDGRLYLYGSWDKRNVEHPYGYCSEMHHVFSTDDMVNFVDHGVAYESKEILFAPDAAYKDGKYYMYICGPGGYEQTIVADTPYGPFSDPKPLNVADGDGIDPSVMVDDDGQAYFFWGQFSLNGARLNPDMRSIDESSVVRNVLTEEEHGFHEGSSIRKINGTYYLVFCDITRGRATCLSYATSDKPLGPYTKRGVLIDNSYCDPKTWNNHGSIQEYKGQLYLFYHRSGFNSDSPRRVCVEKLTMNPDGSINEVEMTSQGPEDAINAFKPLEAARYSRIRCGGYAWEDEVYPQRITGCVGSEYWPGCVEYKYLNFEGGASKVQIVAKGKGLIHVRQKDRSVTVDVNVNSENEFALCEGTGEFKGGIQPVRLFIESETGLDIRSIKFEK